LPNSPSDNDAYRRYDKGYRTDNRYRSTDINSQKSEREGILQVSKLMLIFVKLDQAKNGLI
jgi:hypothetical protein